MSILESNWVGIREAIEAIRKGYIVAYPTETFYGLGVNPYNEEALRGLSDLKGWKEKRPIPILIGHVDRLPALVKEVTPVAEVLMRAFWPGPLTLVFRSHPSLPSLLSGGTDKIGVRISSNVIAMKLVEGLNGPLTTTSANPTGEKGALMAEEVLEYFKDEVSVILQGEKLAGVKGSTVVDVTGGKAEVIREGDLPIEGINRVLGIKGEHAQLGDQNLLNTF